MGAAHPTPSPTWPTSLAPSGPVPPGMQEQLTELDEPGDPAGQAVCDKGLPSAWHLPDALST